MKTKSTAAEEHECEYKLIMEAQNSNMKRLNVDVERLKEELASERVGHRAAASALYRAEAQLDGAEELLRRFHDETEYAQSCDYSLKAVPDCTQETCLPCQAAIFLDGLSTGTPKESA